MRFAIIGLLGVLVAAPAVSGPDIVKVPSSKANVSRPDDLFNLPPGQWFVAKQLWQGGRDPCDSENCEAGFNSGDLVVSVEHAKEFVQVIAGFRNCESVGFSEVETGTRPGSHARGKVADLIKQVVKGVEKTCGQKAPDVPKLDVAAMFPRAAT